MYWPPMHLQIRGAALARRVSWKLQSHLMILLCDSSPFRLLLTVPVIVQYIMFGKIWNLNAPKIRKSVWMVIQVTAATRSSELDFIKPTVHIECRLCSKLSWHSAVTQCVSWTHCVTALCYCPVQQWLIAHFPTEQLLLSSDSVFETPLHFYNNKRHRWTCHRWTHYRHEFLWWQMNVRSLSFQIYCKHGGFKRRLQDELIYHSSRSSRSATPSL